MIAAGYSLYTVTVGLSMHYFAGINQLIPDIFKDSASITLGHTFHLVMGSIVTGMLLVRFRSKPMLIAFIIAIIINFENYIITVNTGTFKTVMDHYLANPSAIVNLLKPLVILPLMTFFMGLLKRSEQSEEAGID